MMFIGGMRRFNTLIAESMEQILSDKYRSDGGYVPNGFLPADKLRGLIVQWIVVPWGTGSCTVKVRTLGAGEYPDVALLDLYNKQKDNPCYENKAKLIDLQLEYCKKTLVNPTYEELEGYILDELPSVREGKEAFERAVAAMEHEPSDERKRELRRTLEPMALVYGCLFPANFIASIAAWCECLDLVDIKKLTPEKLIGAYNLAKINNNRSSDNIPGVFLEHTRNEIDAQAYRLWYEKFGRKK